ncbi:hypothetical protein ACFWI0_09260 [[Kitasatospora] papulosa]|uniref:hypothetical protein n=1 Tax=Streptomyces TaxID=1883 RepID=UPI000BC4A88B|nr:MULTISPECIES: hypothetical protein [unclassified Streptomyces]RAS32398.1 hypothetical protein BCL80_104297 [Streptomyces avidinii]SNX76156.1 hypothetical protein SAMN05421860_102338 [Streptomyces microflavus]MDX3183341.1 hypothetical protein [Streptomyces sp. ME02-7008A-1]MDX3303793.1 hypothetical protein [Streptomyces sp. ME02-7008A]WJY29828.1 hypothetical protein QTO28_02130 [Streptomyces sp. P9-2B-1]
MPRWGLVVEQNLGYGRQGRMWSVGVIGHVEGSREEALAALRVRAERFEPVHPSNPKNRALYREADGFLLVVEGVWQPWHCRFTVAEQLYDSAAPEPVRAPSTAESEPAEPTDATPRAHEPGPGPGPQPAWDAGVPEVPSWLGRDGLP